MPYAKHIYLKIQTVTHWHHGTEASTAGFTLSGRGTAAGEETWARCQHVRYSLNFRVKPLFISHFRQLIAWALVLPQAHRSWKMFSSLCLGWRQKQCFQQDIAILQTVSRHSKHISHAGVPAVYTLCPNNTHTAIFYTSSSYDSYQLHLMHLATLYPLLILQKLEAPICLWGMEALCISALSSLEKEVL